MNGRSFHFERMIPAWLGVDDVGHIAIFYAHGEAPVPHSAAASTANTLAVTRLLMEMSSSNIASIHRDDLPLDDFASIAQRGLYAFGWLDVYGMRETAPKAYELVASPLRPLRLDHLPPNIRHIAGATRLQGLHFSRCHEASGRAGIQSSIEDFLSSEFS